MSFLHYILLALIVVFVNITVSEYSSPRDFFLNLAANLLNLLGAFLTLVPGASKTAGLPHLYSSRTDDAKSYCWYIICWIWEDSAKVNACCVLFGLAAIVILLYLWIQLQIMMVNAEIRAIRRLREQMEAPQEDIDPADHFEGET
jgi:hypothetical protein